MKQEFSDPCFVVPVNQRTRYCDAFVKEEAQSLSFDSAVKPEGPAAFVELVLLEQLFGDFQGIGAFHDRNSKNPRQKRNGSDDRMAKKISAARSLGINDRAMRVSEWAKPRGTWSGASCGLFGAHELAFTHHLHHRHQPAADTRNNRRILL